MPFEAFKGAARRIAVIGGGISGMGAAHALSGRHNVTLFEAENRLGGHARTVLAGKRGDQPVDTGFIVFNRVNYPNLVRLFEDLGVPTVRSSMSFAASIRGGALEYGLETLRAVFAQRRNLASPRFLGMCRDVLRFNARAEALATSSNRTIGELLTELRTGAWFRDYYILPLSGAIWSTPSRRILDFPARALVQFFRNHNLMQTRGQHQWHTVAGGSVEYVSRLSTAMIRRGVDLRLGAGVRAVRRIRGGTAIRAQGGQWETFDDVIFATHSDVTLSMLVDPSPVERAALGAIRYLPNEAVLHADPATMPRRRRIWSAWNYCEPAAGPGTRIDLTYWMNALQPIPREDPMFVTLNSNHPIRDELIYDTVVFSHPVYDLAAETGRESLRAIQGDRNTWYCGAWMKNGFHEDGLASALDVTDALMARPLHPALVAA